MSDVNAIASSQFVALVLSLIAVVGLCRVIIALWRARESDRARYDDKNDAAWGSVRELAAALRESDHVRLTLDSRRESRG